MKLWVLITKYNIEPLINQIEETLLGLAIGDAMGVPVEFFLRETLKLDPVLGFRGYGSHTQLPGTFSDTILNAVNLGGDTDTIGCIAGGLAGLTYGLDENSQIWREQLKRNADIKEHSLRYSEMLSKG